MKKPTEIHPRRVMSEEKFTPLAREIFMLNKQLNAVILSASLTDAGNPECGGLCRPSRGLVCGGSLSHCQSDFDFGADRCYHPRMSEKTPSVLAVVGCLHGESITRVVINYIATRLKADGCNVDTLDFHQEPLPLYNPDTACDQPGFAALQSRVDRADVFILGTPDYHGSMSSAMKNFLDHFWHEFAGKLIAPVVASHEKGLTVIDQLHTVARQCYAWSLPYGVSFAKNADVKDGQIVGEALKKRLDMMVRDVRVYGWSLAEQRRADLAGIEPGFLARLRK